MTPPTFPDAFDALDFGPVTVEAEPGGPRGDVDLLLRWGNESERFLGVYRQVRALRDVQSAAWQVRQRAAETGDRPLLVVPYLSDDALGLLQSEGVGGIDLCGNAVVEVPGRWRLYQRGFPNRFPSQRKARSPYQGKSALVGRALLSRPEYATIGEVQAEVERRGGSLSYSQVAKVVGALADDLVVRKEREGTSEGVRLLQPAKLLGALVEGYGVPEASAVLEARAELGPETFERLTAQADAAGARIVGFDPQRYVIAPQSRERLEVYVEPGIGPDLRDVLGLAPVSRFSNLVVRVVDEPGVYFDPVEADGLRWAPPLEVYLQLMQGGKREKEIAGDLREGLLAGAEASR